MRFDRTQIFPNIDWPLVAILVPIVMAGLFTMNSLTAGNVFFWRQLTWLGISLVVFIGASQIDWRFLRQTSVVTALYISTTVLLILLFVLGSVFGGAQSWFNFGSFSFQPSDPAKLVLIIVLAKYFARRHVDIEKPVHVLASGFYMLVFFILIFLQPDFGSALIIGLIWLGMVLVAGIKKRHLMALGMTGLIIFGGMWTFAFEDYQRDRIVSFLHPLADVTGTGYNAYQAAIAVGSGELWGKGLGFGTQSRLQFLPEYETDFIFAAFSEEWGFGGAILLFALFLVLIWRILKIAERGHTNFERLFGLGVAIFFISHFIVHVGMNLGLLPVTGTTIPFMSYGGSHLVTEFLALGMMMGMRRYERVTHPHRLQEPNKNKA